MKSRNVCKIEGDVSVCDIVSISENISIGQSIMTVNLTRDIVWVKVPLYMKADIRMNSRCGKKYRRKAVVRTKETGIAGIFLDRQYRFVTDKRSALWAVNKNIQSIRRKLRS